MSRVSRKMIRMERPVQTKETPVYRTGIYVRLSNKDGSHGDKESIEGQKMIIQEYLKDRSDFVIVSEYEDNGFTGTNFTRPGFIKLMDDIRNGKVNCIVVKDLSRFGRDFIETGNYIEYIFPALSVRFIAVNDGYDSANPECGREYLLLALKNFMNDLYARDISQKIRPVIHMKQEAGEFVGSLAPFGYAFNREGRKGFVVDEEAAPVIKRIFHMYLSGESISGIMKTLNREQILSPYAYAASKGLVKINWDSPIDRKWWSFTTIKRILENPVYIGNMALRKTTRSLYHGIPLRVIPPEQWIIRENTHERIIDQEVFDKVQEKIKKKEEEMKVITCPNKAFLNKENNWVGKLYCGDCKKPMQRRHYISRNRKQYHNYYCKVAFETANAACHNRSISDKKLTDIVSKAVFTQILIAVEIDGMIPYLSKEISEEMIHNFIERVEIYQNDKILIVFQFQAEWEVIQKEDWENHPKWRNLYAST